MKFLSFLMKGRFAHFCAPYTNVYRLTQPCPTKTAIMGFVGAVLGVEKDDLRLYSKVQCGVEVYGDYRTISMPYLARQGFPGSESKKANTASRTSVEVIVKSKYRGYICVEDEIEQTENILSEVKRIMSQQAPVFTPYLGLAQFIASTDFQVSDIADAELIEGIDSEVNGAFVRGIHGELDFEKINNLSGEIKLRITEFEGLKGISEKRDFDHAVFTVNLEGGTVPLKDIRKVVKIPEWGKNVPVF